jgi:hypothetical protein
VADFLSNHLVVYELLMKDDGVPLMIGDVKAKINLWLAELGAENPEDTIFAIGRDAGVPHSSGTPLGDRTHRRNTTNPANVPTCHTPRTTNPTTPQNFLSSFSAPIHPAAHSEHQTKSTKPRATGIASAISLHRNPANVRAAVATNHATAAISPMHPLHIPARHAAA